MSAPRKPWEEAGINTRSSVVSFDSPSRLLLGAGPPRLHALRDSDFGKMASSTSESTKPPPLPPRPQTQRSNEGLMYGGSRYGKYLPRQYKHQREEVVIAVSIIFLYFDITSLRTTLNFLDIVAREK